MVEPHDSDAVRRQAFIVRAWADAGGRCWGQVADPAGDWKTPFSSAEELWQALTVRLQASPPPPGGAVADLG